MTSDAPQELIGAGIYTPEAAAAAGAGIVASEYLGDDVNTFAGLAGRRVPVGILSEATRGQPRRSARYREVLAPSGIPFELRAAFVTRGRSWGAVHLARREEAGDFGRDDAAALARITVTIAEGIRTSLRFDAARRAQDGASPGMVVLDGADRVELITGPARELLADLRTPRPRGRGDAADLAPRARRVRCALGRRPTTAATSSRSRARAAGSRSTPRCPRGRAADGWPSSWSARQPADHALRLETHGVTAREREIAILLAQRPLQRGDRRRARPVLVHGPGPRPQPVREDGRRLAAGARRAGLPRRLPATACPPDAAVRRRRLRCRRHTLGGIGWGCDDLPAPPRPWNCRSPA